METEVFLDTAYAIALSSKTDQFHNKAILLAGQLREQQIRIVTTRAIMMEIGNAFSKQRFRSIAIKLLQSMDNNQDIEIIPFSEHLYQQAFNLYCQRNDKQWGLIDCVSFTVMKDRNILESLTNDDHFRQAGFIPLMQ